MGRDKRNKIFDKDYIQQSENNNEDANKSMWQYSSKTITAIGNQSASSFIYFVFTTSAFVATMAF